MDELKKQIASMRWMAEYLMPYCRNAYDKADVAVLATREICVHGYDISFYFSKELHPDFYLWSLQMYSKHQGFLPFSLVCECATMFLGNDNLGLCEFIVLGRKLYTWSLAVNEDGTPIPIPSCPQVELREYQGLKFSASKPAKIILA